MIKLIKILFCFFYFDISYAQTITNDLREDTTNIYYHAFEKFCDYVVKEFPKVKKIRLEESLFFNDGIPNKMKNINIDIISNTEVKKMLKHKTYIYVTRIVPLRTKGEVFFVNIISSKAVIEKNAVIKINQGAFTVKYKFDCERGKFYFFETEGGLSEVE